MSDRAGRDGKTDATWPNPVRTLLLLIAAFAAFILYPAWVGGTGGMDPALLQDVEERELRSSVTVGLLLETSLGPALLLLVAALAVALWRAGWKNAEAGILYAVGSSNPRWFAGAARFWAPAARVAAWGGLVLGAAACAWLELIFHRCFRLGIGIGMARASTEELVFDLYRNAMFAPLAGILLGRFVLGMLAEGARVRADEQRGEPVFSRMHDVALSGLFAIVWFLALCWTWRALG